VQPFIAGRKKSLSVGNSSVGAVEVNDSSLPKLLESLNGTILIFLYMAHCPHCKKMMPYIDELPMKRPGLKVLKADVMRSPGLKDYFQVSQAPTIFIKKGPEYKDRIDGAIPIPDLDSRLGNLL